MNGNIQIVIGSWGSYNECNERALGSEWLDLSEFYDWDEIVAELKRRFQTRRHRRRIIRSGHRRHTFRLLQLGLYQPRNAV